MAGTVLHVVTTTFPDREQALEAGRLLVDAGLAVCAQVGSPMQSIFIWQGKLASEQEVGLVLKVLGDRLDLCLGELKNNHPYEVPQIVAWAADRVDRDYLAWAEGKSDEE